MFRKAPLLEEGLDLAAKSQLGVVVLSFCLFISVWSDLRFCKVKGWLCDTDGALFVYRYLELSLPLFKENSQQTMVLKQETSFFVLGFLWALF